MTEAQAATTRAAARIIGPLMLIIGAIVIARMNDVALLVPGILADGPLAFVTGIFTLICGVVLFALHHHWSNATSFVISLLGVLTVVRGVILMLAPSFLVGITNAVLAGAGPGIIVGGAIALLLGAWLSFAGWFAKGAA
jgi:hypothetical protein